MDSVRRAEFLAKPKVKAAVATIAEWTIWCPTPTTSSIVIVQWTWRCSTVAPAPVATTPC